jgi:hypothetical protein
MWSSLWKQEINRNMKRLRQLINVKLMKEGVAEVF